MRLERITLAAEDPDAMAAFYNEVFDCRLEGDTTSPLLTGTLAGFEFALCPNSLAGVVAEQNRHQLRLVVDDVDAIADRVRRAGGVIVNRSVGTARLIVGIADPEGNTYELSSG